MTFEEWKAKQDTWKLPLVAWGPQHSKLAEMYAKAMVQRALDRALNEGNGTYKP